MRDRCDMGDSVTEWYWDLVRGVAVPADQRGRSDHMLGPYATRSDAENWKSTVELRNKAWEDDDEEWDGVGDGG